MKFFKSGGETFSSLKIRNYRLYFIGQAVSLSGTWMQTIGQAWLVLDLTHSGTALGLVTAVQFLPILLFAPLGGVIADRFPKRTILFFTQAILGLLALILGILVATNLVQLWMVYLLAVCLGFLNSIDNPTRQTFVLEMVGKKDFSNAVTLNSSEINMARVIGPVIAGSLITVVGLSSCFIINGFSYVAVIIALILMRPGELYSGRMATKVKGQLLEGFRYVKSNPVLRNTLIMMTIIGMLSYEFQVILPLVAQFTFHGNAATYSFLTAAMGIGSVVGGLFMAKRKKTDPQMLVKAAFLFGLVILLTAVAPSFPVMLLLLILVGVFSINMTILGNVTLQLESASEMRGRVMSLWTVAMLGSTPIGGPIIGWIGQNIGPRIGLGVGGAAALLAGCWGFMTLRESSRFFSPSKTEFARSEEKVEEETRGR